MADDQFRIFVEQLRLGHTEEIDEILSPDFLEVKEKELVFGKPITVRGQVYLADNTLILHFDIGTTAVMPCAVCNQPVDVEIAIKGFYHAVPLVDIKGAVYNFREILREAILLEVPLLAECHQGKCPQRKSLEKYFKKDVPPGIKAQEEGYRPFADLDFDSREK
jgi:uncharacterized metal-binding protein YceD (DUF177 family)